jgi:predicted Rossmann-fold nucleotide-binding protein
MNTERFERETREMVSRLPIGPRVVAIGSTVLWSPESREICSVLGELLAGVAHLCLITGGVRGVGETMGRAFYGRSKERGRSCRVFHLLPRGERPWDYGKTLFAGDDMEERREVLGRIARTYIAVEGGPGTAHEARVAMARCAVVIPVATSGGHAAELYGSLRCPSSVRDEDWAALCSSNSGPQEVARAAFRAILSTECMA